MTELLKRDNHDLGAIERLTQIGTGATALLVGAKQMLAALDVHPSQLVHNDRADAVRDTAHDHIDAVRSSKRFRKAKHSTAEVIDQVADSKRFRRARSSAVSAGGSALDAMHGARDKAVKLSKSETARTTTKALGALGTQALASKTSRTTARKVAPFVLRRGVLVTGLGGVVAFVVGRTVWRRWLSAKVHDARHELTSGERNAELARKSNAAVAVSDVDAPMPSTSNGNGMVPTAPFPR